MTIDRRTFVTGAALVAIAPSLELLSGQISVRENDVNRVVFLIDGWSIQDDIHTSDQVWLRLGHSWRVAWR
jgi:hypothetical protein